MADLLIKDVETPKTCWDCFCVNEEFGLCQINRQSICGFESRPSWCPRIEVPVHGDLVDRDKLLAEMSDEIIRIRRGGDEQAIGIAWAQSALEFAPVVIEENKNG